MFCKFKAKRKKTLNVEDDIDGQIKNRTVEFCLMLKKTGLSAVEAGESLKKAFSVINRKK